MNIYLITGSTGFPNGYATAHRIKMLGKTFIRGGNTFTVYLTTIMHNSLNKEISGNIEGINFEYLSQTVNFRRPKLVLFFIMLKGYLGLINRISKLNPQRDIVYIYAQGDILNPLIILICKLYNIKVIQELNEWYFRQLKRPVAAFIMEKLVLRYSDGAVAISSGIGELALKINSRLKIIKVPVLDDKNEYIISETNNRIEKYCFWMGEIDGYFRDVLFIIEGISRYNKNGGNCKLYLSGSISSETKRKINDFCTEIGFSFENIRFLGFLETKQLKEYCMNAYFYIVPLWKDIRSITRFPTKIATFLFCQRPLITSKIGDIGEILEHQKTVLFFDPEEVNSLVDQIKLLENEMLYESISINSRLLAENYFQFDLYSESLSNFVKQMIEKNEQQ